MRFSSTGDPGAQSGNSIICGEQDMPEGVQNDVERVAELVATGFPKPVWDQMAAELYAYAFGRLCAAMRRTDKLMDLTAQSMTPLSMSDTDRSTLYRSAGDREHLAILTLSVAMENFHKRLKLGGYDPTRNPGKDGRPSRLTSYFYGRCGLVFPRVFNNWRCERTDRFISHAAQMEDGILAYALGQSGPEPVPEDIAGLCDTVTAMVNKLKPRDRAVWLLTVDGCTQGEIADVLGIKEGDVENARYSFRSKVKKLRRSGELYVPPAVETEWARARAKANSRRKAA